MLCPPYGLYLRVNYRRCRDGDTVEVAIPGSALVWAIRLADCNCPELREPGGPAAKAAAEDALTAADQVSLFIPAPQVPNLLAGLSFDRIPAYLFIRSDTTLGEYLIACGHGSKPPQPKRKGLP